MKIIDYNLNREVSSYIEQNYYKIINEIKAPMEVRYDILNKVYYNAVMSENILDGYQHNRIGKNGKCTVENYIFGRVNGWKKSLASNKSNEHLIGLGTVVDVENGLYDFTCIEQVDEVQLIEDKIDLESNIEYILEYQDEFDVDLKQFLYKLKDINGIHPSLLSPYIDDLLLDDYFMESLQGIINVLVFDYEYYIQTLDKFFKVG